MPIISALLDAKDDIAEWRQDLHKNPETAYEEFWTSDYISAKLTEWNIPHTRGWAKTGIVATLHGKNGNVYGKDKTITLRADMDALDITEETGLSYTSCNHGKMHGCGHDGHSAMLMATIQYLSRHTDSFDGTVNFIFQPAEEGGAGAKMMVEEGFFDKYPSKAIFGMHNWPDMKKGTMGICVGSMTAASDIFSIKITGKGGHAAFPHNNIDVVTTGSSIVMSLQTLVSRSINPVDAAVLSITNMKTEGSESLNVMPEYMNLGGVVRTFNSETLDVLKNGIFSMTKQIAEAHGCSAYVEYNRGYPSVVNTDAETDVAIEAAIKTVGNENVDAKFVPTMGAEDFAYFLEKCSGAYIALGQSDENKTATLHSSHYDFNDEVAPIGASYWVHLVQTILSA